MGAGSSGRRIAAMVVNGNACNLVNRGALETIASRLAPGIAWPICPASHSIQSRRPHQNPGFH
ncbi:hypothetical protein DBR45_23220 [Pseudomonas sp. HMWF031]|nr:hypothetical protein DBR45_23220 [Pseudomonas sp. HMWF031]